MRLSRTALTVPSRTATSPAPSGSRRADCRAGRGAHPTDRTTSKNPSRRRAASRSSRRGPRPARPSGSVPRRRDRQGRRTAPGRTPVATRTPPERRGGVERGARSEERGHAARARFPGRNRREWVRLLDLAADVPACAAKERRTLTSPSTRDYHADAWLAATVRSRRPERRRAGSRELELRSGPALGGRPWTIGLPRDDQSVQSTRHPFDKLNVAGVQKSALFRYQA